MNIPDKSTYKTTITNVLREDICKEASHYSDTKPNYLEIGCDQGFTIFSVQEHYGSCHGIDIDSERIEKAELHIFHNFEDYERLFFLYGTSKDIKPLDYHVVLIDADHSFEKTKEDLRNVLLNNKSDYFTVYFHDYGLVNAGVRQFVDSCFSEDNKQYCGMEENWNPLGGPIDGWEAVKIRFTPELKEKILSELS